MKPACMKENDILVEYWISEKQSKEDCEIKLYLRHMRPKEKIKLKIPKASPLISYHKIAGKGKQDAQTGIRGDYYVKVVIETK